MGSTEDAWAAGLDRAQAETRRLAALGSLDLLDSGPESAFDALVAEAAATFGTPMAAISLIDAERQWLKAAVGLSARETPRAVAFCDRAIRGAEVLVVNDAARDPRFAHNPLVTGEPGIRFYAGAPLEADGGERIGTICVIDWTARPEFGPAQRDALAALAARVTALIAQRRQVLG